MAANSIAGGPAQVDYLRKSVISTRGEEKRGSEEKSMAAHSSSGAGPPNLSDATKVIDSIRFTMFSGAEIARTSVLEVSSRDLYKIPSRIPVPFGCLDRRLGISGKSDTCQTCGNKLEACPGHFGYVPLELPVFHIGFLRATIDALQCICKTCSRVLLPPNDRKGFLRLMRNPTTDGLRKVRNGDQLPVLLHCLPRMTLHVQTVF
jgi:DNA-directed RNA polymerase III subunit RPC1